MSTQAAAIAQEATMVQEAEMMAREAQADLARKAARNARIAEDNAKDAKVLADKILRMHGSSATEGTFYDLQELLTSRDWEKTSSATLKNALTSTDWEAASQAPTKPIDVLFKSRSALHVAAESNNPAAAKLLLKHGIDVSLKNAEGKTAMELATTRGHTEVKYVIRDHLDLMKTNVVDAIDLTLRPYRPNNVV